MSVKRLSNIAAVLPVSKRLHEMHLGKNSMIHDWVIKGDEFLLRPLARQDLELVRRWRNMDNIRRCFVHQDIIDPVQQLDWYEQYLAKQDDLIFVIESTDKNDSVGIVGLNNIDMALDLSAEFGRLMIGEMMMRGKGLGLKVTNAVCEFAFYGLNLSRVFLEVLENNDTAIRIYQKAGFRFSGKYEKQNCSVLMMHLVK